MSKKTREQIKYNMSRVKNKNSKIRLMLRKELVARFKISEKRYGHFGKPDIVFKGKR